MSELTPCNRCTLRRMQEAAASRGVTVIVHREDSGSMSGWISARYSDASKPAAYFMMLTEECSC